MKLKELVYAAIFAAITAVLAQITIPMPGGVPFTLQTFAVILAGLVLGYKFGSLSSLIYVLLALVGLPVLSGMRGGPAAVFGLTGGFTLTFPLLSLIAGLGKNAKKWNRLFFIIAGVFVNYMAGTAWFSVVGERTFVESLTVCVLPFVITDAIKIVAAWLVADVLCKALSKAGLLA